MAPQISMMTSLPIRLCALSIALLPASPVAADLFYCGARPPEQLFEEAQGSTDAFVVLLGQLETEVLLSNLDGEPQPPFTAHFEGHSLTADGFTKPVTQDLTVTQVCDVVFSVRMCGDLANSSQPVLLFARRAPDGGLGVEVGPCGQWAQSVPDHQVDAVTARLTACARGTCPVR